MSRSVRLELEEIKKRVAEQRTEGPAGDRELTHTKQRQIVESASGVLFEKGFHRTSIRDIAAACGMSMGQLYHYIASKDDLLYLMHKHMQEVWYQHLVDAELDDIADPVERYVHALRCSLHFIYENKKLFLFLYTESKCLDREHLRSVLDLDDKNVVGFHRYLISSIPGIRLGEQEKETAANLVAFLLVFLALRGWNLSKDDVSAHIEFVLEFILRGLGIERGAPGPGEGRR